MKNLQKEQKVYERHDLEGTPFAIIKNITTGKCFPAIGNNRMCEKNFKTMQAVENYINEKPWDLMLNTMALMCENIIKLTNKKQQSND